MITAAKASEEAVSLCNSELQAIFRNDRFYRIFGEELRQVTCINTANHKMEVERGVMMPGECLRRTIADRRPQQTTFSLPDGRVLAAHFEPVALSWSETGAHVTFRVLTEPLVRQRWPSLEEFTKRRKLAKVS